MQERTNLYPDLWTCIEEYLPNYSSRDDVLRDEILYKYLDKEEVDTKDFKWIVFLSTKAQGKAACEQRCCKQMAFLLEILQP